jgi:hypothetical protein
MTLKEIEERVADLDISPTPEFIYELLRAYGLPKAGISRLRSGTYNKAQGDGEILWKTRVYYRLVNGDDGDLHALIDEAKRDERVVKERPRFLIVRNEDELLALDTETGQTLDIGLADLEAHYTFFLPWAGIEKTQLDNVSYADIKAAEKMAKLYDEIVKKNRPETQEEVHDLNVFFSRLLFCFFAEDTGVFEKGSFTNAIGSYTRESGEDLRGFFEELFAVLNTPMDARDGIAAHLRSFGYVNGKLFERKAQVPEFAGKSRAAVLECARLDWSQINPDIFGSMIQVVVHPSQREGLGMHYTSVENIMKVIRPLFLDDLHQAYEQAADKPKKLEELLQRIYRIQVFDPACGSGNFLVIAYKELRKLEHRIMRRLIELDPKRGEGLFRLSGVELENFYGIEIDDFAHEIATLSLWLAKHQMNVEFKELFGAEIPLIPLKDSGHIVCGNAVRIDWREVCKTTSNRDTFVLGNPPYLGSSMQDEQQKQDFIDYFGTTKYAKNLDYISLWFFKGAEFIADGNAELAFVSTNSVSQGDHVGLMWPDILEKGVEISFAYESFPWSNQARGNAGVTCVIIGLSVKPRKKLLYSDGQRREVGNINPYLAASRTNAIVHAARSPSTGLPPMVWGSKPTDGGHLSLSPAERDELVASAPAAVGFLRRYMGASEFLGGHERFCLWIEDEDAKAAGRLPAIRRRLDLVAASRMQGSTTAQAMADRPYRFLQRAHRDTASIIVPGVSSERREYIPIGFLDGSTVISNLANAIYDAEPWVFGLIQSRMHMVWARAVAGRLESRLRYSAVLVYNTFPVPTLTDKDKNVLAEHAFGVLGAREQFSDKTLAELYDPDKMPVTLREAHHALDEAVDRLYHKRPFESDEERLEVLFQMYEAMTTGGELTLDADDN